LSPSTYPHSSPLSSPFYNKNQFFKEKRVIKGDEWRMFNISLGHLFIVTPKVSQPIEYEKSDP
jgi:hypothetical protein